VNELVDALRSAVAGIRRRLAEDETAAAAHAAAEAAIGRDVLERALDARPQRARADMAGTSDDASDDASDDDDDVEVIYVDR